MDEYTKIKRHVENLSLNAKSADFIEKVGHSVNSLMPRGEVGIKFIASRLNVSTSKLRRVLHVITGLPPAKYVMYLRLRQSLYLLDRYPKYSISAISAQCGFFDHSHFTHTFIRYFGISPFQYVQKTHK